MGHSHMDDVALNYVANESLNHSLKDAYAHLFVWVDQGLGSQPIKQRSNVPMVIVANVDGS